MNFTLILETDNASALRAISTAAAMIESIADKASAAPTFALVDALTTTGLIAEALSETLDGYAEVGFELRTLVTDDFRESLAGQLQALAIMLLEPPPTEEVKAARLADIKAEIDEFLAMGRRFASPPLMRTAGLDLRDAANARGFTVKVGQIDAYAGLLSELVKIGPNAGLLADLADSLCDAPDDEVDLGDGATDEDRLRFSIMESRSAKIRQSRNEPPPDPEGSR